MKKFFAAVLAVVIFVMPFGASAKGIFGGLFDGLGDAVNEMIGEIGDAAGEIKDELSDAKDDIVEGFSDAWNSIEGFAVEGMGKLKGIYDDFADILTASSGDLEKIKDVYSRVCEELGIAKDDAEKLRVALVDFAAEHGVSEERIMECTDGLLIGIRAAGEGFSGTVSDIFEDIVAAFEYYGVIDEEGAEKVLDMFREEIE